MIELFLKTKGIFKVERVATKCKFIFHCLSMGKFYLLFEENRGKKTKTKTKNRVFFNSLLL